jgi:hypothetical protein
VDTNKFVMDMFRFGTKLKKWSLIRLHFFNIDKYTYQFFMFHILLNYRENDDKTRLFSKEILNYYNDDNNPH